MELQNTIELFNYCKNGFEEEALSLIETKNIIINYQDKNGNTILHIACEKVMSKLIDKLFDYDDIDIYILNNHNNDAIDMLILDTTDKIDTKEPYVFKTKDDLLRGVNLWCFSQEKCTNQYGHISTWNVSNITDMSYIFNNIKNFNQPLGSWDVSQVTNMSNMFNNTKHFNQPLGSWNISQVTDMSNMFNNAESFNQPLGSWDVSNVINMNKMFYKTKKFIQLYF